MQQVIEFLSEIELLIYGVLGLIGVLYIRRLFITSNEFKTAMYGLEKEAAQVKLTKTITMLVLVGMLILTEFIIVVFLKPELPQLASYAAATEAQTATATSLTPQIVPTEATKTPTPYPQAVIEGLPSACKEGVLEFTDPIHRAVVQGVVELKGTVNIPSFGSYKYEYSPAGEVNWVTVAAGNQVVIENSLGNWYTTSLTPGEYLLMLVALNNQGIEQIPCIINVTVKAIEN